MDRLNDIDVLYQERKGKRWDLVVMRALLGILRDIDIAYKHSLAFEPLSGPFCEIFWRSTANKSALTCVNCFCCEESKSADC